MKILKTEITRTLTIEDLTGKEIVVYKSKGTKEGHCILSRLEGSSWAFIPMYASGAPRYVSKSKEGCLFEAGKNRQLLVFDSYKELISAIHHQKI